MPMVPSEGVWTVDDLQRLPDDGLQYELADGVLLVTPSPRPRHQRMSMGLTRLLLPHCVGDLELFAAPFDFQPNRTTSLQPDLLVVRREDVTEEGLVGTPLLVVEVLSPSTRAKDLVLKRALYAEASVPSYWVVDPAELTAVVLELRDGLYVETARVTGDDVTDVTQPFALELSPARLLR